MKKSATFLVIAGVAAISSPAIAETKETSFNQTATDFEYVSNQNSLIAEQPQDSDINDEDSDEEERTDGFYFPLAIGGQQLNGVDASTTINGNDYDGSLNSRFGFAGETGIGYKSGDFRFDLLYGYNDLNKDNYSLSGNPSATNQTSGSANLQTLQFGVSYDINTNSRWTPYVGGTIGAGWLTVGSSSFDVAGVKYKVKGDTASALVYGGKVGLSYKVSRRWDVFVEGAYLRTNSFDLNMKAEGKNTTEEEVTEETKVFDGTNKYQGGVSNCSSFAPTTEPTCYDTEEVITTTTVSTSPTFKNMDFGPGNGWSAKLGFRWFFNQNNPAPVEVVEEIQVEPAPAPVYEEPVYQAPPQGTPVRALW